MTVLGAVAVILAAAWVVIDPLGAAHEAAWAVHQVGIAVTWLAQHFSHHKPGLTGVAARIDQGQRPA